jgi:hypothetical protein
LALFVRQQSATGGCFGADSLQIRLWASPDTISTLFDSNPYCPNTFIQSLAQPYSLENVKPSPLFRQEGRSLVSEGLASGTYIPSVTLVSRHGCKSHKTGIVTVVNNPFVTISGPDTVYFETNPASYRVDLLNLRSISWFAEGGIGVLGTDSANYFVTWSSTSKPLMITANVITKNGCLVNASKSIFYKPTLFIPNLITRNQEFSIRGIEQFPAAILKVYNRWGALVHEITDNNQLRLGALSDLQGGIYFYIISDSEKNLSVSGWIEVAK